VLHGRGSVDAKGPLAAMLCAAASVDLASEGVASDRRGRGGGRDDGIARGSVPRRRSISPDACVIGEPSGWNGVTLGYKGSATCVMSTEDACAHTAGPDASAADRLLAAWNLVQTEVHRSNHASDRAFDKIQATVRQINSQTDGLTEHVELLAGFRLPPAVSPTDLRALVERITCRSCTVRWNRADPAYQTDRNDPVVRALSNAIRACGCTPRPKVKTGTADMNVVGPVWRCPIAAYGPGDSSLDHTPNEHLQLDEYHRSIHVFRQAIGGLASELLSVRVHPSGATATP
jgi:LysW-gamma-L-lysine carboxypeptidase